MSLRIAAFACLFGVSATAAMLQPRLRGVDSQGDELLRLDAQGELSGEYAGAFSRTSPVALAPRHVRGGVLFNGGDDVYRTQDPLMLPASRFSVEGWVAVETPRRWGGILGAIEDNGNFEKGWVLGYDDVGFTLGISTEATDDGDGRLIYRRAEVPYSIGAWHHVAATYDGETARLYVDGELATEIEEAGGPVVMADSARLVLGAYADSDEFNPLDGRIADLTFVQGTLAPDEIAARAARGAARAGAEAWTDAELDWRVAPYLTWPRPDGVSVLAESTTPSRARLFVRKDTTADWTSRDAEDAARLHEFRLEDLEPGTKYFYRVDLESAVGGRETQSLTSEVHSFRTAPPEKLRGKGVHAFTFTVVSDTQTQGDVAARVSALAFEHRPNFVVHCGDLVDTGSTKSDWTETFFPNVRPLIEHAPLVPVLGNHEQDAKLYYDYMSLPEPERWYRLRYGNAEFFLLDGNRSMADQSEQLIWLKKALKDSTATWRFAVLHQPPYTSDSNDYGDTAVESSTRGDMNVRNIVATLERHGVDLVFSGHVHDYERTFPIRGDSVVPYAEGGIVYVTAAGAGGGLEDFDGTNTWFGHKKMRRHHFVHVAIHGDHLELQAMDEDGRMFDSFELTQRGR